MKKKIIVYLKSMINDTDDETRNETKLVLKRFAQN